MALRPSIDTTLEQEIKPQEKRGFPTGCFLIRAHHSRSTLHGRRLLQVAHRSDGQASEIIAWVDESKGELKQAERLEDHDNQVFYIDKDGRLHSKADPECFVHCRLNPNTKGFELVLRAPQGQPKDFARRACQFSYNSALKTITVWAPTGDGMFSEQFPDTESPTSASSTLSSCSLSEVIRKEFLLEIVPQRHHSTVARLWNYYSGSNEDEEQHRRTGEPYAADGDVLDNSWHRGREVRVVAARDTSGYSFSVLPSQKWDLIPLLK